ncbi:hypothetical protein M758_10G186700 [Ceratodon purpureus]|nr:hypothetical protein M758_10G186700 [Ceratodon purpureus]
MREFALIAATLHLTRPQPHVQWMDSLVVPNSQLRNGPQRSCSWIPRFSIQPNNNNNNNNNNNFVNSDNTAAVHLLHGSQLLRTAHRSSFSLSLALSQALSLPSFPSRAKRLALHSVSLTVSPTVVFVCAILLSTNKLAFASVSVLPCPALPCCVHRCVE